MACSKIAIAERKQIQALLDDARKLLRDAFLSNQF